MADTPLAEQLIDLTAALTRWQQALTIATGKTTGAIGTRLPDGGISGPIYQGYQLIVAPANRRARNLCFGLHGIDTGPALSDSGWHHSNQLLADHFARDDGYSVGPHAVLYCRSLGPDWYLPDRYELQAILAVAAQLDAADTSDATRQFSALADQPIWTSSPGSHGHWSLHASDGMPHDRNRREEASVLPIRRIALP